MFFWSKSHGCKQKFKWVCKFSDKIVDMTIKNGQTVISKIKTWSEKKKKRSKLEVTIWHDMYEVHYFILSFSCSWSIEEVGRLDETKKMYYFWERKWEKSGRKKWKNIFSFEDRFRKKTWAGAKLPIKKTAKEVREKSTEMSELLADS